MPNQDGPTHPVVRLEIEFRGIVQGVGFRPAVYRAATALGLTGFVQNRRSAVVAEVQGTTELTDRFILVLHALLPKAARIDSMETKTLPLCNENGFSIAESLPNDFILPPIPPDLAICKECAKELFDPSNRRYLYPFITCTQCGPRYSIVEETPFDRDRTSMHDFTQCPECMLEYSDPQNRRFHSQTNSCSSCGPTLVLTDNSGNRIHGDPVLKTIEALAEGKIAAIQGIGGFHIAVDPKYANAVRKLREKKGRERKPFALMVRDSDEADSICLLSAETKEILSSPLSPILILNKRPDIPVHLVNVSDTETLGIMLPYTPLHLLLFLHPQANIPYKHLIMTSGNEKGEPVIANYATAFRELSDITDVFLWHDRRIVRETDDSVLRPTSSARRHGRAFGQSIAPVIIRRSRGFVPDIIQLPKPVTVPTLALGGDLKNAAAFAFKDKAYLCPHIGDLETPGAMDAFQNHITHMLSLYRIKPERVVYDMHPGYRSSAFAESMDCRQKTPVQHHHAHILSVMAEHGLDECLGIACDGTGYGTDGTVWGGEFLYVQRSSFRRLGSFRSFRLPGAEAAIRYPLRIAYAMLSDGFGEKVALPGLSGEDMLLLNHMLEHDLNCPLSSSLGRIFDAASAVLGIVSDISYEGEGAVKLEAAALSAYEKEEGSDIPSLAPVNKESKNGTMFRIDAHALIRHLSENAKHQDSGRLSLLFHRTIVSACIEGSLVLRKETGLSCIALSGGVFQNILMRMFLFPELEKHGFSVCYNTKVPAGDGGLALGQAYFIS